MRIYLDQTPCDVPADSVSQAITGAAALARRRGRAIVDVMIDGQRCPAESLDQPRLSGAQAGEIHLTTADSRQLVAQAFDDASNALAEADRLQQQAAELLQADRAAEAMQRLGEALEIWSNVRAAVVMGAEMAGLDLAPPASPAADVGHDGPQARILALASTLRTLQDALTSHDTVTVSDTLLYDLPDVVAAWREMLCDLTQRVGR